MFGIQGVGNRAGGVWVIWGLGFRMMGCTGGLVVLRGDDFGVYAFFLLSTQPATKHHEASCGPCMRMSSFSYTRGAACQFAELEANLALSEVFGAQRTGDDSGEVVALERGKSESRTAAFVGNLSPGVWGLSRIA